MRYLLMNFTIIIVTVIYADVHAASVFAQEAKPVANPSQSTTGIDIIAEKKRSVEAVKAFSSSLQTELKNALKEGGPLHAIAVCNTKADLIAMDVSDKQNLTIKRVSLKNRNPDNAPNIWQKKVLEDFENRKLSGESMTELSYTDVVESGRGKQFRFMKAIPTKAVCIKCHGTNIAPAVKERLDQLYPNDKARGFRPGDIRGAFVVTRDILQ